MERVDLKAVGDNASYIKLSVSLDLSSLGYERTKVPQRKTQAECRQNAGRMQRKRRQNAESGDRMAEKALQTE